VKGINIRLHFEEYICHITLSKMSVVSVQIINTQSVRGFIFAITYPLQLFMIPGVHKNWTKASVLIFLAHLLPEKNNFRERSVRIS
jgi:hypothetical protein